MSENIHEDPIQDNESRQPERMNSSSFQSGSMPGNEDDEKKNSVSSETGFSESEKEKSFWGRGKTFFHGIYCAVKDAGDAYSNSSREEMIKECFSSGEKNCSCSCDYGYCFCQELFPWLGFVGITMFSGWISSLFLQPEGFEWFASLNHPVWAPPQWIFPPVWLILYFLLGTSVWLAWRKAGCRRGAGILVLFALLLFLQISWCYSFFFTQNPFGGFINLIWVFTVLGLLVLAISSKCRLAAMLLLPQMLWILYALVLNYQIWKMN
ncbi:MAG: tryptophan-rich sensory protein [Planctomycetaceae bacterium]|nr:tryptophan-rich sensory protein [Planctomycetaceae bacterium]MDO4426168.1 TspO/MBR family protein [Planctomycetia bacterium]